MRHRPVLAASLIVQGERGRPASWRRNVFMRKRRQVVDWPAHAPFDENGFVDQFTSQRCSPNRTLADCVREMDADRLRAAEQMAAKRLLAELSERPGWALPVVWHSSANGGPSRAAPNGSEHV